MADIVRDVFLAFVRVHLLHHAADKPIYGVEMMEELGRHGYKLSPGTLYPIFAGLVEAGFLRSDSVVVEGKVRKYYSITSGGRKALAEFKEKIRELVGEALYGEAEPQVKGTRQRANSRVRTKKQT
ncbi:MAG TPA: PadR family transcriptional regulator [Burkholderiales bacterium]|nr:PadR family transcriptional regulator [Burkholderiales bacterium]